MYDEITSMTKNTIFFTVNTLKKIIIRVNNYIMCLNSLIKNH